MDIIDRVLALMDKQGISKAELQKMSGLKKSTFYNIFDNKTNPDKIKLETMRPIAEALNTTLDFHITGKDSQTIMGSFDANTIIAIGRGGKRTVYKISDEDAAIVDAFLNKFKKD